MLYVYLHIFYAFMTYLFLSFSIFLGYKVRLQVFSNCHKSQKSFFYIFIEKKSAYKWTHTIHTCVVQESAVLIL